MATKTAENLASGASEEHERLDQNDAQILLYHALVQEDNGLPEHLRNFSVVLPHPNGKNEKLSPPQYAFPNGLYLLMAPMKHRKHGRKGEPDLTQKEYCNLLPPYLRDHVADLSACADTICYWNLTGPQFSLDGDILPTLQLRYCTPKGAGEYDSQKRAVLYTVYDQDQHEVSEFRVLHVYDHSHSDKRARASASEPEGRNVMSRKKARRQEICELLNEEPQAQLPESLEDPPSMNEEAESELFGAFLGDGRFGSPPDVAPGWPLSGDTLFLAAVAAVFGDTVGAEGIDSASSGETEESDDFVDLLDLPPPPTQTQTTRLRADGSYHFWFRRLSLKKLKPTWSVHLSNVDRSVRPSKG